MKSRSLFLLTLLLLVIAASRFIRTADFRMDTDEIWSVWQTFGTPEQIIQWTSPTETPIYFLLLGAWKALVGIHPDMLRYLSLLIALPGAAFMYRALRRMGGENAGILGMLAYAALAVMIFISLYTRSYVIAYAALPLTLWMLHRYFDKPRFKRALPLAAGLLLLYAATVTVVLPVALLGIYALLMYGRRVWRGWLPAVLALLPALPDLLTNKLQMVGFHAGGGRMVELPPLPAAAFDFFNYFTSATPVWYGLIVVSALGFWYFRRRLKPSGYAKIKPTEGASNRKTSEIILVFFWLLWIVFVPVLLYVLESRLGFYTIKRYGWWYGFGTAIFIGLGLAYLPRIGRVLGVGVLLVVLFVPFPMQPYGYIVTPLGENLRWLRDHWASGDGMLIDTDISCNFPEEWDFYTRAYFPNGLNIVQSPDAVRRLWYAGSGNDASRAVESDLLNRRAAGRFVGPPGCLFRLYEAPPDTEGILYENGMRFHGFDVMEGDRPRLDFVPLHEGETIRVRLWWSVDEAVPLDYSVSLLLQRGDVLAQNDNPPQVIYPEGAPVETSRWTPGQLYIEERTITLPYPITPGRVGLMMAVYWFGDNVRLKAPGVNEAGLLELKRFPVVAW